MWSYLIIFSVPLVLTYFGIELYRQWSVKRNILDRPNDRSSHDIPTPRGGGIVFAAISLSTLVIAGRLLQFELPWGYIAGAVAVVGISWVDDLVSVPVLFRFAVHVGAALLLVFTAGSLTAVGLPGDTAVAQLGIFAPVVTVAWVVWLINAYNFMDGIDGLAGLQAVITGLTWAAAAYTIPARSTLVLGLAVGSASLGFLLHNWQPARIFMGDAGSAFLGFTFAALPVLAGSENAMYAGVFTVLGLLFVWFFVFDTVLTLLRRLLLRERVWTPHREHLYQKLIIAGKPHKFVAAAYGIMAIVVGASIVMAISSPQIPGVFPLITATILSLTLAAAALFAGEKI